MIARLDDIAARCERAASPNITKHHRPSWEETHMVPAAHVAELLATLTPKQAVAVDRLTGGATHAAAAAAAGVARETVTRWVSDHPGFRAALDRARYASSIETIDRVSAIRSRALDVVAQHLDTLDASEPVALAVAVTVLKVLTVPAVPADRPEPATTLAYRKLGETRDHDAAMREAGPVNEGPLADLAEAGPVPLDHPPAPALMVVTDTGDPAA